MQNRKFKINPPYFLFMIFGGIGGLIALYSGLNSKEIEPLLQGGFLLLVALILFALQVVPIPKVGEKVEEEIARLFPAESKRKILILITNGFTGYDSEGVHSAMLKFSRGDLNRLEKLSRALNAQSDFREAYPLLEHINKVLDQNEHK